MMIVFYRCNTEQLLKLVHVNSAYRDNDYEEEFKHRDITPLSRVSGSSTLPEILRRFENAESPIIIDEYVWFQFKKKRNIKLAIGALRIKDPKKTIVIWHNGIVGPRMAKWYEKHVDYVFIESYWPWKANWLLWFFFRLSWIFGKNIRHKFVHVLGINDNKEARKASVAKGDLWHMFKWANDEKTMRKQLTYIHDKCYHESGIGFFVHRDSSDEILQISDRLVGELFGA
jgi:hypothetical protein